MKITAKQIELTLGKNNILKGLDLEVGDKQFVGVLGPNGSGKTTFLKTIHNIYSNYSGSVFYADEDINKLTTKQIAKKVSVVGQHNYYDFDFTVMDIVLMGRSPHKSAIEPDNEKDYDIAIEVLEQVEMLPFARRYFSTLSGGEQQRVVLARALAQQAEAIILDEPTNHLDIKHQIQFLEIVKSLNVEVIGAFHNLGIAAMYCDKLYLLKAGKIFACGNPVEVLTEDNIRQVYGVKASVNRDQWGNLAIAYKTNGSI